MKHFAAIGTVLLLAVTGSTQAGPISVSDNNIGDIVTVGVNVQANVTTDIQTSIVNILVALLTHIGNNGEQPSPVEDPAKLLPVTLPEFNLIEELGRVKQLTAEPGLSREQKTQIWQEQVEAMLEKVVGRKN